MQFPQYEKSKKTTISLVSLLDKLSSKKIYPFLISNVVKKSTSNNYFETIFENIVLNWNKICLSSHLTTIETTLHSFQY